MSAADALYSCGLEILGFGDRDRRASPAWTSPSRLADRNVWILWLRRPKPLEETREQTFEKANH